MKVKNLLGVCPRCGTLMGKWVGGKCPNCGHVLGEAIPSAPTRCERCGGVFIEAWDGEGSVCLQCGYSALQFPPARQCVSCLKIYDEKSPDAKFWMINRSYMVCPSCADELDSGN